MITVQSDSLDWFDRRTTNLELHAYADRDWIDINGELHGAGNPENHIFVYRVAGLTNNTTTHRLTIPEFDTVATRDAIRGASVRLNFWIVQVGGQSVTPIAQVPGTENGIVIPATILSSTIVDPDLLSATWADLITFSTSASPVPHDLFPSYADVARLIALNTGFPDPMTTRGDIIVRNASNVTARLALGAVNTVLFSNGSDLAYGQVTSAMLNADVFSTAHSWSGAQTFGSLSVSGAVTVFSAVNAGLRLGAGGGVNTPYIDWFSSGNATYDTRLIASEGDGSAASGILNLQGQLNIAPKNGTLNAAFSTTQVSAGSAPGGALNLITITDTVAGGGGFVDGLRLLQSFGGGATTGGRQAISGIISLTAPTNASNNNHNYVGGMFWARALASDGGGVGTEKGAFYGSTSIATADSGATNLTSLAGTEINTALRTGSSALYKEGLAIVSSPDDAVQGSLFDVMLALSNQSGAVGWKDGIIIGNIHGAHPISTTGTLFRTLNSATVDKGIDLSSYTFTSSALATPGFLVTGAGRVRVGGSVVPNGPVVIVDSSRVYTDAPSSGVGAFRISTGTGLATNESLIFGVSDSGYSWIQAIAAGTATRDLLLNPGGGNIAIGGGIVAPLATLHVQGTLHVTGLAEHADNAAALAASLTAGAFYRTGDGLKVVH